MPGRPSNRQKAAATEVGRNQVNVYGTVSSLPFRNTSFIPSLQGMPLLAEMERMWFLDETVGAMAFCLQSTLAQADWRHMPAINGEIDDTGDEDALAAAKFANTMLVDMKQTMQEHVEEAITMIPFGFAPCEIVCKIRDGKDSRFNDGFWGIKKLPLRDVFSIWTWIYENDEAVAFKQMGMGGTGTIPLWKTLNYRASSYLDNPAGRPFLLNVHRSWRLKQNIQDSEAIGIERDLCGLPTFRVPEEVLNAANLLDSEGKPTAEALQAQAKVAGAIKAVSDMRFNRSGGLVMPSDTFYDDTEGDRTVKWDFKLVTTAGQRSIDTRTAARDYDRAIARVLMMQFLHLGDRSSGSYALSADQSDIGIRAMMGLAKKIAGEWNRKVIPIIWALNGMPTKYMPVMRAHNLNKDGIVQLGQFLGAVAKAAPLWETDPVVRRGLLSLGNLPFDPEAQAEAAERAKIEPTETDPFGGDQNQPGSGE